MDQAQADYSTFVSMNEDQATKDQNNFWLAGNPGYSDKALAEFAAALHAILDSTSPAHAGFQVWDWRNPALVWKHTQTEKTITPQQLRNAVSAARNAFNTTFHPQVRMVARDRSRLDCPGGCSRSVSRWSAVGVLLAPGMLADAIVFQEGTKSDWPTRPVLGIWALIREKELVHQRRDSASVSGTK